MEFKYKKGDRVRYVGIFTAWEYGEIYEIGQTWDGKRKVAYGMTTQTQYVMFEDDMELVTLLGIKKDIKKHKLYEI